MPARTELLTAADLVGPSVMAIDAWPSWVWMSLGSAPALIISDAAV